jgi:ribulose-5-phosphate 4-epimerase/fuculose-1-phosphate aldolase
MDLPQSIKDLNSINQNEDKTMREPLKNISKPVYSESETALRIQLAACYRIFDYMGWDELIYNHISVKLVGNDEHFLINPYGLHYSEVTASSLVKVDVDGNIVEDTEYQVNPAGITIHTAIHAARPDIISIGHLHSDAGMAVACSTEGLRHDNFYSVLLAGKVAYHPFEGITVNPEEKQRLIKNLGNKNQLILRNHGILSGGSSIPEMFSNIWDLQRSCEVQVEFDKTGRPIQPISDDVVKATENFIKIQQGKNTKGQLEFEAMKRKVTALDDSFIDL